MPQDKTLVHCPNPIPTVLPSPRTLQTLMDDMAATYYQQQQQQQQQPPSATHHYPYYAPPPPPAPGSLPPQPPSQPPPYPYPYPYPHHHHHHQHAYAAPYTLPPPHQPPPPPLHDEVRTLFIAGMPEDVKQREIYNLFREFPGYVSCQLRNHSSQAYAFAVFTDQHSAVTAMHALNGMVFDLERDTTLHIDLAKSNSRPKRPRAEDGMPYSSDKKVRGSVAYSRGFPDSGVGSNIHMPGMGNSGYSTNDYSSTQSHTNYAYEAVNDVDPQKLRSSSASFVPQNNTPCATLFVANLGPTCSEQELTHSFSRCPGFLKLKMQNKKGVPVAFVDFQDAASSTGALNNLQGAFLHSSIGEGMRLEYAKARMGLRRREKKA